MSESQERSTALRELLVDQVDASTSRTRPHGRLGALLLAVAVASGVTGAVSAGAIARSDPYEQNVINSLALSVARPNSTLVGEAFYIASKDAAAIDLGDAPANATGVAIRTGCTEAGSVDVSMDGVWIMGLTCDEDSPSGGAGVVNGFSGSGSHSLTFESPTGTGYESWVAWVEEPPLPGPSTQQLGEISDGVVTREEYLAAFYRFSGCLGADGYDVPPADPSAIILSYGVPSAAADSGTDERCYRSEFIEVDTAWQLQNEDASYTTQRLRDCLSERGIAPAERTADIQQQLEDAGISIDECFS
jgi:hypothetical protein